MFTDFFYRVFLNFVISKFPDVEKALNKIKDCLNFPKPILPEYILQSIQIL